MTKTQLEIIVHRPGQRPLVEKSEADVTLRDFLSQINIKINSTDDTLVFVGECEAAIEVSKGNENSLDVLAPVDIDLTLGVLGVEKHHHVHCHRCRVINTTVNYSDKVLNQAFSPATTVEVATKWSIANLNLDPTAASEFVLQLSGNLEQPRLGKHLGELVQGDECTLSFDLVREITPQG